MKADKFGQNASQIIKTLAKKGYTATETDIIACLHRQKEAQKEVPASLSWNAQADTFAVAAVGMGQSIAHITRQLCENGYTTSTAEVAASLQKQGVGHISG